MTINWIKTPFRWRRREKYSATRQGDNRRRRGRTLGEFVDGIIATNALAGTPGTFEPAGAAAPANFAALQAQVPTPVPGTGWTTGEGVDLGDASSAYWDGSSWQVGTAP